MQYEVLEMEEGDVLSRYASLDEVRSVLLSYLEERPEYVDELAVAMTDDKGGAVTVLPAGDFLAAT